MMVPVGEPGLALPGTVLVVEDDHDVRVAVRITLESEGYQVHSVTDGRRALEFLERSPQPPDLILLDLMMPGMDGWEFATRLRASHRLRSIPVVAIPAFDEMPPPGIVAFLRKPLKFDALLHLAAQYCHH
jgi:two-component system, sensor histidine kinase and response regulator